MTTTTTALARIAEATGYNRGQVELVKETIAKGASDDELMLFLNIAQRSGLDPFSKQIYLIERRANVDGQWRTSRQPQTGIDGLRLIADRTGNYAPGRAPIYTYTEAGQLETATAYVKKWVRGEWHEVPATAHYSEYVQTKKDGQPTQMWGEKPHIMLAKCAEALALRRTFPAEMSGLYTADEIRAEETPLPARPQASVITGEVIEAPAALPEPRGRDTGPYLALGRKLKDHYQYTNDDLRRSAVAYKAEVVAEMPTTEYLKLIDRMREMERMALSRPTPNEVEAEMDEIAEAIA